jgi:hypothetical protein
VNKWLRRALDSIFAVLWISGCAWLVLQLFFRVDNEFGATPHPWQPSLLLIHGVAALFALFVIGWVAGTHVEARWRVKLNRGSGIALLSLAALLGVSGFASFYLTGESMRAGTATIHEVLGVLVVIPALVHWFGQRRIKRAAAR